MRHRHGWFARHCGGGLVPEGVYWNLRTLEFVQVKGTVDFLPRKEGSRYIRLPIFLAPIAGLLLSLLYVLAFPLAIVFIAGLLGIRGIAGAFRHFGGTRFAINWN